jgi:hypothetical protein
MSMHIVGPWLSTTGKKKGKKKWPSAEAKRQAEQLNQEWQELKKRHNIEQEDKRRKRALAAPVWTDTTPKHRGADDPKPKSLNTWVTGAVNIRQTPQYTGTKIIGIGTMHKSNAVPIFSDQEAIDISRMRRG